MNVYFTFRRPLLRSNTDESDIDDHTLSLTTCPSSPSNPLKISHKIKLPKRDSNEGTTPSVRPPHYVLHIQEDCYKVKKLEQHSTYTSKYIIYMYLSISFISIPFT